LTGILATPGPSIGLGVAKITFSVGCMVRSHIRISSNFYGTSALGEVLGTNVSEVHEPSDIGPPRCTGISKSKAPMAVTWNFKRERGCEDSVYGPHYMVRQKK